MCAYVKAMFPTLPVGVVHAHNMFEPAKSYHECQFIVTQYASRYGDVTAFRDDALAQAARDGIAMAFSLNLLNGGEQAARDGLWDCSVVDAAGRGTSEPNCEMTPQQISRYAAVLGPAGCALLAWRYDSTFMADPGNAQAFRDIALRLRSQPSARC